MRRIVVGLILLFIVIIALIVLVFNKKEYEPIDSIKSFSFHFTTGYAMNAYVDFDIDCEDKCIANIKPSGVAEEDSTIVEIDKETVQEVIDLLNKYNVSSWDGFDKVDKNVLDGNSFHLYLTTKNDRHISASGYMKWPKNYGDVKSGLQKIFERLLRENI